MSEEKTLTSLQDRIGRQRLITMGSINDIPNFKASFFVKHGKFDIRVSPRMHDFLSSTP